MIRYSIPRPLTAQDDSASFDSGEVSLDEYLRIRALTNQHRGASRCFVTCRQGRVIGYYALAASSVEHRAVPGRIRRNVPDPIPVILLSRLAVDRTEQGNGVGKHLLRDAITRCVTVADLIGVQAMLVHALHEEARAFYTHFGFSPSPSDELHLLLPVKDARALVGPGDR